MKDEERQRELNNELEKILNHKILYQRKLEEFKKQ